MASTYPGYRRYNHRNIFTLMRERKKERRVLIKHKKRLIRLRPDISHWGFATGAWLGDNRTTDGWGIGTTTEELK